MFLCSHICDKKSLGFPFFLLLLLNAIRSISVSIRTKTFLFSCILCIRKLQKKNVLNKLLILFLGYCY